MHNDILRIGCAAGFSGDRTDAAGPVVDALLAAGGPAFLIFETLAERTLALAQLARRTNPDAGYEPLLDDMLRPVLARCLQGGIRIVSNFGAAHPDFEPLNAAQLLTALKVEGAEALCAPDAETAGVAPGSYLRLWPHRHHTDGFFAAVWQRRGG